MRLPRLFPRDEEGRGPVLDAGCGTGSTALVAARFVGPTGTVSGCDASPEMVARAQGKARRDRMDIDFRVARAESLPYEDASLDVVISIMMMHHLRWQMRQDFGAECRRVLKPGGRVLVTDIGPPIRGQRGLVQYLHRHHFLDLPGITSPFTDAGFEIRESGPVGLKSLVYALLVSR